MGLLLLVLPKLVFSYLKENRISQTLKTHRANNFIGQNNGSIHQVKKSTSNTATTTKSKHVHDNSTIPILDSPFQFPDALIITGSPA